MEVFEQYRLINQRKWTDFLKGLDMGEHTFTFPSIADIKSCKSVGYTLNTDCLGRFYSFDVVSKADKIVKISVTSS